jgi:hypothetical protein
VTRELVAMVSGDVVMQIWSKHIHMVLCPDKHIQI